MKNEYKLKKYVIMGSCAIFIFQGKLSFAMEADRPNFDHDKKMFYYGPRLNEIHRLQRALSADVEDPAIGVIYPIIDGPESIIEKLQEKKEDEEKYIRRKNYKNNESILKERDRRRLVLNPQQYPWCVRGQLIMTYFDKDRTKKPSEYVGSGTLIDKKYVLTAAHNLYDEKKGVPDRITFFLGLHGTDNYIAQSNVTHAAVAFEYIHPKQEEDEIHADIGLVVLETPINIPHPLPTVRILNDTEIINTKVTIAGYPGQDYMYFMDGDINEKSTPDRLFYDIDTKRGQSGSGVILEEKGKYYLVGVHAYGARREKSGNFDKDSNEYKYNSATRINGPKMNFIEEWKNYFSKI